MGDIENSFEDWYLSFSDNDESLLEEKTETNTVYANETVKLMYWCFKAGFCFGQLQ